MYGLVAGTCALIGIGALAMQFYARQAQRPATATPPVATSPVAASPVAIVRPVATATATPAVPTAVAPTITPPMRPAAVPAATPALAAAVAAPARAPAPADELAPPATAAERQARCTEILQKASLASITPAETVYFKRECK